MKRYDPSRELLKRVGYILKDLRLWLNHIPYLAIEPSGNFFEQAIRQQVIIQKMNRAA